MKKLFFSLFSAVALLAVSCTFDDSELWGEINSLKSRVDALEQLCNQMNTNISAMQTIIEALQKNDYVTNIAPITEGDKIIGYTISFSKSDSITIYHGKDGKDGQNGADGKDGYTPQIGVKQDADGLYYWTLDGEWLLDNDGNKIKAQGVDGKDGEDGIDGEDGADGKDGQDGKDGEDGIDGKDGKNGTDGIIPQLKIENGYWYVSYDNGTTWTEVGQATGDDGDSMFEQVNYDDDYVYITLADGMSFTLPRHIVTSNKIYYTSSDGKVVTPHLNYNSSEEIFGADIISNVYENGQGVITFDGSVTSIGVGAFRNCLSLTSITLPNSVTSIGNTAFYQCYALTSITIPDSVTSIGSWAFAECKSLTSITIPNGVTSIGDNAFAYCSSLTSITIPNSVTSIGNGAFAYCSSLASFDGKYASADNRCLIVDGELISFAPAGLTSYTIPDSVTSIGGSVFGVCRSLESITIPNSVISIGVGAFSGCPSLTSFYGKYASVDNRCLVVDGELIYFAPAGLTSYTIPNDVASIGSRAFAGCKSLTSITIPNSVTAIGDSAFSTCSSLASITIPNSVTSIGGSAFYDCSSLTSITIPSSVTAIGYSAFGYCRSLTSITLPDSDTSIGVSAFEGCSSLTSFDGKYASADNRCLVVDGELISFAPAGLNSYTIPDSVTAIGDSAFFNCGSLESITIPSSVTAIGSNAFSFCSSLTTIYCKPTMPPMLKFGNAFDPCQKLNKIYIPEASINVYESDFYWSDYADKIEGYTF